MKKILALIYFSSLSVCASIPPPLKIHWLGTASYVIQFGDTSIMTDPFYSQSGLLKTGLGKISSNPKIVADVIRATQHHPKPSAIFIGHSHYDHMLDTAELLHQTQWQIPVFGSLTTKNLLAGFSNDAKKQFVQAQADGQWHTINKNIRYMAKKAEHADQLPGVFFYPGTLDQPLNHLPTKASDFKLGQTYAYLFELQQGQHKKTIYFTGAATPYPIGLPNKTVKTVDVAILCVPSWQYTKGYPDQFVQRLQPTYIIPSHYNNFLTRIEHFSEPRTELFVAGLRRFCQRLRKLTTYPGFKRIWVPTVGEEIIIQ